MLSSGLLRKTPSPLNTLQGLLRSNKRYFSSSSPLYRSSQTKLNGTALSSRACAKSITRKFSVVSRTRLPVRSFWIVTAAITVASVWTTLTENETEEQEIALHNIQNTDDLVDIAQQWEDIYNRLYNENWEVLLNGGIVQIGVAQLKELLTMIPFTTATYNQLIKKRNKLRRETQEHTDITHQLYTWNAITKAVEQICHTLSRLCELRAAAELVVMSEGLETIAQYTQAGVDNYHLGDLWNSVLKHDHINQQLLEREGFVDVLQKIYELREPDYSPRQVYNALMPIMRIKEGRESVLNNEKLQSMLKSYSPVIDDGFRKFLNLTYKLPVSTWSSHTRTPPRKTVFKEKRDLRDDIVKLSIFGLITAAYIGVRWKRTLPNMSTKILMQKMGLGFVGLSAGLMTEKIIRYNVAVGPSAKTELNEFLERKHTIDINHSESKHRQFHKVLEQGTDYLTTVIFLAAWYNVKFLILPFIITESYVMFTLPTLKELKKGIYIKMEHQD